MIYSKDKIPTEPGFYWHLLNGCEAVLNVTRGPRGLIAYAPGVLRGMTVKQWRGEWGDRIETPTVDQPNSQQGGSQ